MSEFKKSIAAAAWVVLAAGMVVVGSNLRDRSDLASAPHGLEIKTLVASREIGDGARGQSDIPAGDFFYELTEKLKQEYVEPITDEQKLASGAVRGMVGSLGDPKSIYMDKDSFRAFNNARQGKYEGIGADLEVLMSASAGKVSRSVLQPTPTEEDDDPRQEAVAGAGKSKLAFPRLTVTSVVPGGPADRAGVRPGDQVYSVDDHWVINGDLAAKFAQADKDFKAKRITIAQLNALRKEVRAKYERMLLPLRAKDRLFLGKSGAVKVVWDRQGTQLTTTIQRAPSQREGFTVKENVITLPFVAGSPAALKAAVAGKSSVTIDLRNNTLGDFGVMRQCLAVLAPTGVYGYETNERSDKGTPIKVTSGNPTPPAITLLTDKSTRGAAEIFALALSSKGIAKLSGSDTGGAREIFEVNALPDGSGYTLVTARYRPQLTTKPSHVAGRGVTSR